jgi:short-subunit dehydrogenase
MKSCLITGASRGIGHSTALKLSNKFDRLYLHGRDEKALNETINLINKNKECIPLIYDFSNSDNVYQLVEAIDVDQIDVLVNNAGMGIAKPFEKLSLDNWNLLFSINVTAPFILTQKLIDKIPDGGSVVNILSTASKQVFTEWSAYCMTKFALDGFMKTVREEVRDRGVRVINIYPGATDTDIWNNIPGEWDRTSMVNPDDIAHAILFAISQPANTLVEDISIGRVKS